MKRMLLLGIGITVTLASCGSNTATTPSKTTTPAIALVDTSADPMTAQGVADNFIAAGVDNARLEQIKADLATASKYIAQEKGGRISAQSANDTLKANDTLMQGLDIALNTDKSSRLQAQETQSRATLVQATRNIALGTMSNFQYNQSVNTFGRILSYVDNGCSTPVSMPVGNAVFYPACDQHDFGYRNGALWRETHNSSFKGSVDATFNSNMFQLCRNRWGSSGGNYNNCTQEASVFYAGVKAVLPCVGFNTSLCWPMNYRDEQYFTF